VPGILKETSVYKKPKTSVILYRQRKHFFCGPQGTASCRETVDWGEKEAYHAFDLVAGEGALTGGNFEI